MKSLEKLNGCPYKGLQPYGPEDTRYFFGRNSDCEIIASNICSVSLTVLHGASGVGKSSLLMAGLMPRLEKISWVIPIIFRDWQQDGFQSLLKRDLVRAVVKDLSRRNNNVAVVLDRSAGKARTSLPDKEERVLRAMGLLNEFVVDEAGVVLDDIYFDDLLAACSLVSGKTVLIVFDQFEEYFLYHRNSRDRDSFDAEIARSVNRQDINANFLLSLREDSLSNLDRFQGRIVDPLRNMLRLDYLDRSGAEEAIRKPLDQHNAEHSGESGPVYIEDALVNQLLDEVRTGRVTLDKDERGQGFVQGDESGHERIETPFLQMVLARLWEVEVKKGSRKMSLTSLNELGGAERIISKHLDDVLEELGEANSKARDIAASLFGFLVTPSGAKVAHTLEDLTSMMETSETQISPVLNSLVSARIVRAIEPRLGFSTTSTRYEIFHDVLAPAVLAWRAQYVQDRKLIDAKRLAEKERLRAEAEAKTAARLRWLVAALAIVTLLALGSAIYAISKQSEAKQNRLLADQANRHAEEERRKAEEANNNALKARNEAELARVAASTERDNALVARQEADVAQQRATVERARAIEQTKLAHAMKSEATNANSLARVEQAVSVLYRDALEDYKAGDTKGSVEKYKQALVQLEKIEDRNGQAATLMALGATVHGISMDSFKFSKADLDEALDYFTRALSLYRTGVGGFHEEAVALLNVAKVELDQSNAERALSHFNDVVALYKKNNDYVSEVNTLNKIAEYYDTRPMRGNEPGKFENYRDRAYEFYDRGAEAGRNARDSRAEGFFLFKLAKSYSTSSNRLRTDLYKQAMDLYVKAGLNDEAIQIILSEATQYGSGCGFQYRCDDWIEVYEKALQMAQRSTNQQARTRLLELLAQTHLRTGNKQKALEAYDQMLPTQNNNPGTFLSAAQLAIELKDYRKALDYIAKFSGKLPPGMYNPFFDFQVTYLSAEAYVGLGDVKRGFEFYEKTLEGLRSDARVERAVVLQKLATLYESMGQSEKAKGLRDQIVEIEKNMTESEKRSYKSAQ